MTALQEKNKGPTLRNLKKTNLQVGQTLSNRRCSATNKLFVYLSSFSRQKMGPSGNRETKKLNVSASPVSALIQPSPAADMLYYPT